MEENRNTSGWWLWLHDPTQSDHGWKDVTERYEEKSEQLIAVLCFMAKLTTEKSRFYSCCLAGFVRLLPPSSVGRRSPVDSLVRSGHGDGVLQTVYRLQAGLDGYGGVGPRRVRWQAKRRECGLYAVRQRAARSGRRRCRREAGLMDRGRAACCFFRQGSLLLWRLWRTAKLRSGCNNGLLDRLVKSVVVYRCFQTRIK